MEYTRVKSYVEKYGYDYLCLDCKFDVMPTAKLKVGTFKDNDEEVKMNFLGGLQKVADLTETLETYLDKNCNVTITAETLFTLINIIVDRLTAVL